jgi:hypothetical protein
MAERWWTVDEANAALPRVAAAVERARAAVQRGSAPGASRPTASSNGHGRRSPEAEAAAGELADAIAELERDGVFVRDIERGLVDFPARSPRGRPYWLCWLVGEPEVAWWHWPEDGFAGRTSIDDPPA